MAGWIGVDLDGTLALHGEGFDINHIGDPIPAMVERVKAWRAEGHPVRIVTARVGVCSRDQAMEAFKDVAMADLIAACGEVVTQLEPQESFIRWQTALINAWCEAHLGERLPVTCEKDFAMWQLWDDRVVQVVHNTGTPVGAVDPGRPVERQAVLDALQALPPEEFARLGVFLLSVSHGHRALVPLHEATQAYMQTPEAGRRFGGRPQATPYQPT